MSGAQYLLAALLRFRWLSGIIILAAYIIAPWALIEVLNLDLSATLLIVVFLSMLLGAWGTAVLIDQLFRRALAGETDPQEARPEAISAALTRFSELQHTEETLRNELDDVLSRYELLTNNIAASVIIRRHDGRISFCSPYTEVLTGYAMEEILDDNAAFFELLVLENDVDRFKRAMRVSELGEDIIVRYQVRHKSGIKMWLETRMVPVLTENSETDSTLMVTIDVTQVLNHQRQVEEQNRDLNDFAYMVSHDLKAPIFTIKGMVAALKEDYGALLPADALELLNYINDASRRLEQLVSSVIEYSSISSKSVPDTDVNLSEVLSNVLQDFSEQIKQSGAKITAPTDLGVVRAPQVRIYQALSNLIGNAIKYRDPNRPLEINVSVQHPNPDSLQIEVADNGLGIPVEKQEDVFRPYHRAHGNTVEGSGIGLACVKKIAERLGGAVSLQSTVGVGSTFFLTLPSPASTASQEPPPHLARIFQ